MGERNSRTALFCFVSQSPAKKRVFLLRLNALPASGDVYLNKKETSLIRSCIVCFKRKQIFSAAMFPPVTVIAPLDTVAFSRGWTMHGDTYLREV
jgi:hypothetical protein